MRPPRVLAVAVAIALAVAATAGTGAETSQKLIEPADRAVRIATVPCARDLQATSSGFVVDDRLVMTVAHALHESRHFAVRDAHGVWHDGRIVLMDLELDVALVWVDGLRSTRWDAAPAEGGQPVRLVDGAASGSLEGEVVRRVRLSTEVIGDRSSSNTRRGYELSVEITGGDSGAAVIDDQDRLIAMVFARSNVRSASWATSAAALGPALHRRGVPAWECERPSDVELVLPDS